MTTYGIFSSDCDDAQLYYHRFSFFKIGIKNKQTNIDFEHILTLTTLLYKYILNFEHEDESIDEDIKSGFISSIMLIGRNAFIPEDDPNHVTPLMYLIDTVVKNNDKFFVHRSMVGLFFLILENIKKGNVRHKKISIKDEYEFMEYFDLGQDLKQINLDLLKKIYSYIQKLYTYEDNTKHYSNINERLLALGIEERFVKNIIDSIESPILIKKAIDETNFLVE